MAGKGEFSKVTIKIIITIKKKGQKNTKAFDLKAALNLEGAFETQTVNTNYLIFYC